MKINLRFKLNMGTYFRCLDLGTRRFVVIAVGVLMGMMTTGCKKVGYQSGTVVPSFSGIEKAIVLSPTSVKLTWTQSSRYSEFRVYRAGVSQPLSTEQFSEKIVTDLLPASIYQFSVTGFNALELEEEGLDNFTEVKTFNTFTGLSAGAVSVQSSTRINLTWTLTDPSVSYDVFYKEFTDTWDFSSAALRVTGSNLASVTGLKGGTNYCFFVQAAYLDGTKEPLTSDSSAVAASTQCGVTSSDLNNLPSISMYEGIPGSYPWFTAIGGDATYLLDVFELASNQKIGSRIGNGPFKSFSAISVGPHKYYAVIKNQAGAQARSDVVVGQSGGAFSSIRNMKTSSSFHELSPPLLGGGKGLQSFGQVLARGDFNCDGFPDLAVSAPDSTPAIDQQHFDTMGSVVIYYTYDPPPYLDPVLGIIDPPPTLNTSVAPSSTATFPNPQLVYFPVTVSSTQLGLHMSVGNANGDCFYRDSSSSYGGLCDTLFSTFAGTPNLAKIRKCDDLAFSNSLGQVFVAFGDPTSGLVAGSGSNNFGVNELTCDAVSNSCRSVRLSISGTNLFGRALTFGDFNNDGFDDLAVGAVQSGTGVVYVFRGSGQGLYPQTSSKAFDYILASDISAGSLIDGNVFDGELGENSFSSSLATAYNSRNCNKGLSAYSYRPLGPIDDYGFDFGKCDDLVIGVPLRLNNQGSIVTCKAKLPLNSDGTKPDKQKIYDWTCEETIPSELYGLNAGYGSSLVGVENMNGYPLDNAVGSVPPLPSVTGAVFVGAPYATVSAVANAGSVYGYYVTPQSDDHDLGGIQGILTAASKKHQVTARNTVPCNPQNNNVTTGPLKHCEHQVLYNTPAQASSHFGFTLGVIDDFEDTGRGIPSLAVGAPFRDVLSSGGSGTLVDAGALYVYRADISTFGVDGGSQVTQTQASDNTLSNCLSSCTWYSGGVSPFGPSMMYPSDLNKGAHFSLGGIVGGDFNGDGTGDVISSAPQDSQIVSGNGAAFLFLSSGTFGASVNNFDKKINPNFSKELNYKFERAKVVGDINGDGYDDVLTYLDSQGKTALVLFYGSIAGLISNPAPSLFPIDLGPKLIGYEDDLRFGFSFHRIGSVNGDAYDDILVFGNSSSYIFYGSFAGLISSAVPQISPTGKNPLIFGKGNGGSSVTLRFDQVFGLPTVTGTYDASNQSVGYGDFNGDGYSDMAIAMTSAVALPSDQNAALSAAGISGLYGGANRGSVAIVYGGTNGPQTNRSNGRVTVDTGSGTTTVDVVAVDPCAGGADPICKVQLIASPEGNASDFGFSILGFTSIEESQGEEFDELLVGDNGYSANSGRVYLFKGTTRGLSPKSLQTLVPYYAGHRFGYNLAQMGDINGDDFPDLGVSSPGSEPGYVYVFYGGLVDTKGAFYGPSTLVATDYWTMAPADPLNKAHIDVAQPWPQILQPLSVSSGDGFGYGLSSAGDFNQDGFFDLFINVAAGDYNEELTLSETGYGIIYFGSALGLQALVQPSTSPQCYVGSGGVCNPFQLYLPNREAYEHTWMSGNSSGDLNGDGVEDILFGGFGRTHPSGLAYSVGIIYVIY